MSLVKTTAIFFMNRCHAALQAGQLFPYLFRIGSVRGESEIGLDVVDS